MSCRCVTRTAMSLLVLGLGLGGGPAVAGLGRPKGAVVLPTSHAPSGSGRRMALLVGNQHFVDSGWPALRFPEQDATAMADRLAELGSFATTLVVGEQTTRQRVLGALRTLRAQNQDAQDTVVVYVSTHGTLARDRDGQLTQVLVLSDTQSDRPAETGLLLSDLLAQFDGLPSQRKVLILATCYSGAGKSSLSESVRRYVAGLKGGPAQPLYEVSKASVVLSASAWGQAAREDDQLGQDIYTHFLLEALLGFDPNHDGATSVTEAHDFARQKTYRFTRGAQRPTAIITVEGDDPIVLAGHRQRRGDPVLLAYEASLDGYRIRVDGREKGTLPGGVVVAPGWHEVVVERPPPEDGAALDPAWQQRLHLTAGQRLSLTQLMEQEPSRQITVQVGGWMLPGSNLGDSSVLLGGGSLQGRIQGLGWSWLVLSLGVDFGWGRETWQVNQERIPVTVWAYGARLGPSVAWQLGRLKLDLAVDVGLLHLDQRPDSEFFDASQRRWIGYASPSGTARWRLGRNGSVGVSAGVGYVFGERQGVISRATLGGTWSF